MSTNVRLISFYLPQFHPIPENDRWWGKGFTEWTNVAKARPNFEGHYQPHYPADLGFYDLRVPEVRDAQAKLASQYGIHGFCYHYYWFSGKKLLERPFEEVLRSRSPDFPFCICWANENWTRRWDGAEHEVLMAQDHSPESDRQFIHSLFEAFRDARYITINGRPLLVVYRVSLLPDPKKTAEIWRDECRKAGIGDIYLCAAQSFGIGDPRPYGFDAAVEFPPHGTGTSNVTAFIGGRNDDFCGNVYDYEQVMHSSISMPDPDYRLFKTVMPSWDNTPRRQNFGHTYVNSSPENYEYWLREIVRKTIVNTVGDERLVFVNAWNEWGEGCHLEPDRKYGHRYLEATRNGLQIYERFEAIVDRLLEESDPAARQLLIKRLSVMYHNLDRSLDTTVHLLRERDSRIAQLTWQIMSRDYRTFLQDLRTRIARYPRLKSFLKRVMKVFGGYR